MQNLRGLIEANISNAKSIQERERIQYVMDIIQQIDIYSLSQELKEYIVSTLFGFSINDYNHYTMQQQLKEAVKKEADAKARKAEAEARVSEKTAELTISDIDKVT